MLKILLYKRAHGKDFLSEISGVCSFTYNEVTEFFVKATKGHIIKKKREEIARAYCKIYGIEYSKEIDNDLFSNI